MEYGNHIVYDGTTLFDEGLNGEGVKTSPLFDDNEDDDYNKSSSSSLLSSHPLALDEKEIVREVSDKMKSMISFTDLYMELPSSLTTETAATTTLSSNNNSKNVSTTPHNDKHNESLLEPFHKPKRRNSLFQRFGNKQPLLPKYDSTNEIQSTKNDTTSTTIARSSSWCNESDHMNFKLNNNKINFEETRVSDGLSYTFIVKKPIIQNNTSSSTIFTNDSGGRAKGTTFFEGSNEYEEKQDTRPTLKRRLSLILTNNNNGANNFCNNKPRIKDSLYDILTSNKKSSKIKLVRRNSNDSISLTSTMNLLYDALETSNGNIANNETIANRKRRNSLIMKHKSSVGNNSSDRSFIDDNVNSNTIHDDIFLLFEYDIVDQDDDPSIKMNKLYNHNDRYFHMFGILPNSNNSLLLDNENECNENDNDDLYDSVINDGKELVRLIEWKLTMSGVSSPFRNIVEVIPKFEELHYMLESHIHRNKMETDRTYKSNDPSSKNDEGIINDNYYDEPKEDLKTTTANITNNQQDSINLDRFNIKKSSFSDSSNDDNILSPFIATSNAKNINMENTLKSTMSSRSNSSSRRDEIINIDFCSIKDLTCSPSSSKSLSLSLDNFLSYTGDSNDNINGNNEIALKSRSTVPKHFLAGNDATTQTRRDSLSNSIVSNSELAYVANYMYCIPWKSMNVSYTSSTFSSSFHRKKSSLHPTALSLSRISFIGDNLNDVILHYEKHGSLLYLNAKQQKVQKQRQLVSSMKSSDIHDEKGNNNDDLEEGNADIEQDGINLDEEVNDSDENDNMDEDDINKMKRRLLINIGHSLHRSERNLMKNL